jgi:hypothetical protein
MDQKQWEDMKNKMAIEAIVMDLIDIMVPADEARQRAEKLLAERQRDAVNVEYRMGQALIALKKLGYEITHIPIKGVFDENNKR